MATKQSKFSKIKSVTLPVLKVEKNTERGFYFHGPMFIGEKVDPKKDPATLIHAVDVETGEEGVFIVPAVAQKELVKAYGAAGYVGKCFALTMTRVPEKNYNLVTIDEIAAPDGFTPPKSAPNVGSKSAIAWKGSDGKTYSFPDSVAAAAALAGKRRDDDADDNGGDTLGKDISKGARQR